MGALIASIVVLMIAAAALANSQEYPGPSQRIEPTQPMQSMQPMQPMAPLPAPPMMTPGDNPATTTRPAEASDQNQGSSEPPAGGSEGDRKPPPADTTR